MGIRYRTTPATKESKRPQKHSDYPEVNDGEGVGDTVEDVCVSPKRNKKGRRKIEITYVKEKGRRENIVSKRGTGVVRKITEYANLGNIASWATFYNFESGLMRTMFSQNTSPELFFYVMFNIAKQMMEAQGVVIIPVDQAQLG